MEVPLLGAGEGVCPHQLVSYCSHPSSSSSCKVLSCSASTGGEEQEREEGEVMESVRGVDTEEETVPGKEQVCQEYLQMIHDSVTSSLPLSLSPNLTHVDGTHLGCTFITSISTLSLTTLTLTKLILTTCIITLHPTTNCLVQHKWDRT